MQKNVENVKELIEQELNSLSMKISSLRTKAEEQKSPILKKELDLLEKYYKMMKKRAEELVFVSAVGSSIRYSLKAGGRFQRPNSDKVEVAQPNKKCLCGSGKKFKKCCYSEMAI